MLSRRLLALTARDGPRRLMAVRWSREGSMTVSAPLEMVVGEGKGLAKKLRLGRLLEDGLSYKESFIVRSYEVSINKTAICRDHRQSSSVVLVSKEWTQICSARTGKASAKGSLKGPFDVLDEHLNVNAGTGGGRTMGHFGKLLESNISIFAEEMLLEHFNDLIKFLNSCSSRESSSSAEKPSATDLEPLVRDFLSRREAAIELMNKDVITFFSNCLRGGRNIMNVACIKLHFYYGRLRECARRIEDSDCRDLLPAYYLSYKDKYFKMV